MKKIIITLLFLCFSNHCYAQDGNLADVNGADIYYEVYGNGKPLVLLHGFTLSHEMWDPFVEDLSESYKVILVDMRGHGRSSNPTDRFTHNQSAQDIYGLMDELQIESFKAMGFSSGGMTLTHMATMDSTRLESIVLMGATSYYPESTRAILRGISYETMDEDWLNMLKKLHPGGETQIRSLITQFSGFENTYEDMNFTPPYLSTIKASTLIIHGDRDPFFPVDIPVISYKNIPNSYLWIVPNFGHQAFDMAAGQEKDPLWADTYMAVVKQFLSGEWSE
jgi:pimeloyl-ACP methyl ester carboxylesterase